MKVSRSYFFMLLMYMCNVWSAPLDTTQQLRDGIQTILLSPNDLSSVTTSSVQALLPKHLSEVRIILDGAIRDLIERNREVLERTMPHPQAVTYSEISCYQIIQQKVRLASWFFTGSSGGRRLSYLSLIYNRLDHDLFISITQEGGWVEFDNIVTNARVLCSIISEFEKQRRTLRMRKTQLSLWG